MSQVTDPASPPTTDAGPGRGFTEALVRASNGGALSRLIATLLEALGKTSGFDATFVTVVDRDEAKLRVGFAHPQDSDGLVPVGMSVPLPPNFPERAYLGVSRSVEEPSPDPDSRIAQALGLQTYASVPIITADYRLYGMLCGASREPHEVSDDTIAVMEFFARLLVDQMARDNVRAADRRAQDAERRLHERIDFLAQAEHMLKTPLTVIAGWVEQLRAGTVRETQIPEALETIARSTEDLTGQVERLLEEVAADVRTRDLHIVARDLEVEIGALVRAFNGAARGRRVIFRSDEHVHAFVDPALLVQIVVHLLDNAVKYSEPDSVIEVIVSRRGERADVVVQDHGIGLPDGVDVFAPFQRGSASGAEQTTGVGLGLHIVRNLVHAMNGRIVAEPHGDRGAKFTVTLPLATTDGQPPTLTPQAGEPPDEP